MNKVAITNELLNLIKLTLPDYTSIIESDSSLHTLVKITENWRIGHDNS